MEAIGNALKIYAAILRSLNFIENKNPFLSLMHLLIISGHANFLRKTLQKWLKVGAKIHSNSNNFAIIYN